MFRDQINGTIGRGAMGRVERAFAATGWLSVTIRGPLARLTGEWNLQHGWALGKPQALRRFARTDRGGFTAWDVREVARRTS